MRGPDIISRADMQALILRNQADDSLSRPVYVAWTHNRPKPMTTEQLESNLRSLGARLDADTPHLSKWTQVLESRRFFVQPKGQNKARPMMRPLRTREGWTEVEFNQKVQTGGRK
jgi:hypothetical protein